MRLFTRNKYTAIKVRKKDLPGGLWVKCPECTEIVYKHEIESGKGVCPKCSYHFSITWQERLALLTEPDSFVEWDADLVSADPLQFQGQVSYAAKLADSRKKSGMRDAIICGKGQMGPLAAALGIMDFRFLGGSMGSVVGEKVARLIEKATAQALPLVIISATGGARMYEGLFSLMQMAKTSAALARHAVAGLPYISVLTHPSTAGVMASYASLGDVIIAEPGALIGFAGPRVIKETTREDIPPGFQRSDFMLRHGLVDAIIMRQDMKDTLIRLIGYMSRGKLPALPEQPNVKMTAPA
jgi:acetyl-CoA carboxylase carboxyl transferase subunit beta